MTAIAAGPPPAPPDEPRQLHAQDSNRVYQAAGDQYIYDRAQPAPAPAAVTNTLPRDTPAFTGREEELEKLTTVVVEAARSVGVIPIHVIDGMAGIGKTALAVHAAHLLEKHFPDGQLFVHLHAHTANQSPVDPAEALYALLSADGMPPAQIPDRLDERAARWRARMAGKRMLLIMDDAAGQAQVEPLLPGAANCLVLVTSRRRLTGLGARHAPVTLSLGTLPPEHAAALFVRLAGRTLADSEARAVDELARLCGYLPLAISLLAAKLRPEPLWTVADVVADLTDAHDRLGQMHAEDIAVAAAFDLSYRNLPAPRRRFFRRLGLHPGTDFDAYAAAALDRIEVAESRRHLEALYEDHLLDQPVRGRYRMHDLVGAYTRTLLGKDAAADREQAIERLFEYYQHACDLVDRHLSARPRRIPAAPDVSVPDLSRADQAMVWMQTEIANLLACAAFADRHGQQTRVINLTASLSAFLLLSGPWQQAIALHQAAASAAHRRGDRRARAAALLTIGVLQRRTGDYPGAMRSLRQALVLRRDSDDLVVRADVLNEYGTVHRLTGAYSKATERLRQALEIYRSLDDRVGLATALTNLAVVHWLTDDLPSAIQALQEASDINRVRGDRRGLAQVMFHIGVVRRMTCDYPAATKAFHEALDVFQEVGDRLNEANARHNLGVVRLMTSNYRGAADALGQALEIYKELGDRLGEANALKRLGAIGRLTGEYPFASGALQDALVIYQELGDHLGQAGVLLDLGVVHRETRNEPDSTDALQHALAVYRRLGSRLGQAEVLNHLGTLLLQCGKPRQAIAKHSRALVLAREVQCPLEEARALDGTGQCEQRLHDNVSAAVHLRQAHEIYLRIGAPEAQRANVEFTDRVGPPPT